MKTNNKIYVAGHQGLVGSAIVRKLHKEGFDNLLLRSSHDLDLTDQAATQSFFRSERPGYVTPEQKRSGQAEEILRTRAERKCLARLHRLKRNRQQVSQPELAQAA